MSLTKKELTRAIAAKTGKTIPQVAAIMDATFDCIVKELGKGENVSIAGFGVFEIRQRAARKGQNINSGEPQTIPARNVAAFRAGAPMQQAVRSSPVRTAKS